MSTSVEEDRLAEAEVALYRAKLEAILGIRYDADEFDGVVARYRAAKRSADAARLTAQQAQLARQTLSTKAGMPAAGADWVHPQAA
jgi:hypothetical protein